MLPYLLASGILAAPPAWIEPHSRELTVFPLTARLNTVLATHQFGFAARFSFPLHRRISITIGGRATYWPLDADESNWFNDTLGFEPVSGAKPLLVVGGLQGGIEGQPLVGAAAPFGAPMEMAVVISAALGAVDTRARLYPGQPGFNEPSSVSAGWRLSGQLGIGIRLRVWRWVALRLELHDLMFSQQATSANGCGPSDLSAMDNALRRGARVSSAAVSPQCAVSSFEGVYGSGRKRSDDVPLALNLVKAPAPGFQQNVELYVGCGVTF